MIQRLYTLTADGTAPVRNLAMEAYLLETVPEDACILYLWQNAHTVVVGRNQNAWKECRVSTLRAEGGRLVRRLSGGGAVYHDLGNLNFTFLLAEKEYDLARQQEVLLRAARAFGLDARITGRNDIEIDGRKFSGNAFYRHAGRAYHHGTLLLHVDTERMGRYLNADPAKLAGKGVDSVRARVVNLCDLQPRITVDAMRLALTQAFGEVYRGRPQELDRGQMAEGRLREMEERFGSWDWIFGRPIPFTWRAARRFDWGGLEICLEVERGRVKRCVCYSDAMDERLAPRIAEQLTGCPLSRAALCAALSGLSEEYGGPVRDVQGFLSEQEL